MISAYRSRFWPSLTSATSTPTARLRLKSQTRSAEHLDQNQQTSATCIGNHIATKVAPELPTDHDCLPTSTLNSEYRMYGHNYNTSKSSSSSKTMQESNAYTNTGDTVPANSLPTPEASLAQQLKLEETLTCLDRGDTLSPL